MMKSKHNNNIITIVLILLSVFETNNLANSFILFGPLQTTSKNFGPVLITRSSSSISTAENNLASTSAGYAIKIEGLTCSHDGGNTYQLNNVNYSLPRNGKIGLLGRNGCGKSTFLKILAMQTAQQQVRREDNNDIAFTGKVEKAKTCRVAYVEQETPPIDVAVAYALFGIDSSYSLVVGFDIGTISTPFEAAKYYKLAEYRGESSLLEKATILMDQMSGSWAVLTRADEIATRLRVQHLLNMSLINLSGGERKRVALAAALITEPDVLLLDEVTNHLDLGAIRWLSDLILEQKKMTVLVVTHDRAFLDQVCQDGILELDRGNLYPYDGTYANFLEAKEARWAMEDANLQTAKSKYKLELEWMRRQPQARQTKAKARIEAFYKLEKATKPTRSKSQLTLVDDASLNSRRRLGNTVLKCVGVSLSFQSNNKKGQEQQGSIIVDDFTYDFNSGDRIGIVGKNGVGKSTFLKILTGAQPIDAGEIITGETVVFGIYDQMGLQDYDENQRVLDYVKERVIASDGSSMAEAPQEAMRLLKKFEFPSDRWNERVATLSGGERRRLQLLTVITKRPNFLILDEPSNDLDSNSIAALEQYLDEFKGVLVVVSHDRYFTDKVTDHLFIFEGDGSITDYLGTLSDYAEILADESRSSVVSSTDTGSSKATQKEEKERRTAKRNLVQKYKRELTALEPALEKLKAKSVEIQKEIDNSRTEGWSILAELTKKLQSIADEIEEKENRWFELAEALEDEESS